MERRRDERNVTNVLLTCRVPARPCRAILHDLSRTGCRLELPDGNVELGGTALLDLPAAGQVAGRVVWVRHGVAGIEFLRRLSGEASIALGLDEPPPPPPEPVEPVYEPNLRGMLRHWMRRLTSSF